MPRFRKRYFKHKIKLYFDENFPKDVVDYLKSDKGFAKNFKVMSVYDFGHENRDDKFHFNFCNKKKFVLVTLDDDFMDDKKFPLNKTAGVIFLSASGNETSKVAVLIGMITNFLRSFPLPNYFIGNTKFRVSHEGCVIRGLDAQTREVKTLTVTAGDTMAEVASKFNYL